MGKLKATSIGSLITTLIYTFLTLTTLFVFSPVEFSPVPAVVIYMLKAFKFQLVERPNLYFLSLWIPSVFTSVVSSYLYLGSVGFSRLSRQKSHQKWVW